MRTKQEWEELEAPAVRDDSGTVTGYWARTFIPVEEYDGEVRRANDVIESYQRSLPPMPR